MKELKLNVGCGTNKIKGYVNIDRAKLCKPDLLLDITTRHLPYKVATVDEIVFFHCIEHIRKWLHRGVLQEFSRVLKPYGRLYISYPNFWECAKRWHDNENGQKTFWEATLYGRQLYPGDSHVCAMNPDQLTNTLYECGFHEVISNPESDEPYNTITSAIKKGPPIPSYETVVARDLQSMVINKELRHGT